MPRSFQRVLLLGSCLGVVCGGAGFLLRKSLAVSPTPLSVLKSVKSSAVTPVPEEEAAGRLRRLLSAGTPWERAVAVDRLAALAGPGEWPAAVRQACAKDPQLGVSVFLRWLERDAESALSFAAEESELVRLDGRWIDAPGLESAVVRYLAAAAPERGWRFANDLRSPTLRGELLAALCKQDPAAAAAFITAHGGLRNGGMGFSDLASPNSGEIVMALCREPRSTLGQDVLWPAMSDWVRRDHAAALEWWRTQPPEIRARALSGLGNALRNFENERELFPERAPLKLSREDLELMADAARLCSRQDRQNFYRDYLSRLGSLDPVAALVWVGENLHGEDRGRGMGGISFSPEGALEVISAWDRVPRFGWDGNMLYNVAATATRADPEKTLAWLLTLPRSQAIHTAGAVGTEYGLKDPAAARRMVESLDSRSPLTADLAGGVAVAQIPRSGSDPFNPPPEVPAPEMLRAAADVLTWVGTLEAGPGAAAAKTVFGSLAYGDPALAAEALAPLTAPHLREVGLEAIWGYYIARQPEAAVSWAEKLPAEEREKIRGFVAASDLPEARKSGILNQLDAGTRK